MNPPTADERASFICDTCQLNHSGTILVAQQIRAAEAAARLQGMLEEREACARVVDTFNCRWESSRDLLSVATAIRARSEGGAE